MYSAAQKLGKNLRDKRTERGMTQADLASVLNLDKAYISNLENGKCNPTLSTIENLAKALQIQLSELVI